MVPCASASRMNHAYDLGVCLAKRRIANSKHVRSRVEQAFGGREINVVDERVFA